jgi:mRNA interferase MazF
VRSTRYMTASVSRYRPWDVVVVPFPYSDQTQATVRPGVIVSAPRLHQKTRQYYVAMVTNAKHTAWDGDVAVSNLKGAGLPAPSVVRPAKLATFDESTIVRAVGSLPTKDRAEVLKSLTAFLASS